MSIYSFCFISGRLSFEIFPPISRFSSTLLLHTTPLEILILLNCLLLMYFGKTSVEVIARVNDLFYPLFVVTITIMPLLLSNEFYLRLTTPFLTMPIQHWTASSILTLGSAGDVFILGAFLHMLVQFQSCSIRDSTWLIAWFFSTYPCSFLHYCRTWP